MASSKAGCAEGASQRTCIDLHLRGRLSQAVGTLRADRQCPVCGGNISINTARKAEQHVVITCHGSCATAAGDEDAPRRKAIIRQALVDLGADEQCLGGFGKLTSSQLGKLGPGGIVRCHHDQALEEDGLRFRLALKIPRQWVPSIREMAMQRIAETDASDLPADPWLLVPTGDRDEFYGLAARTGIDKRARSGLHNKWMSEDGSRRSRSLRSPTT